MSRLNARWFNFAARGQAWDHFWQDAPQTGQGVADQPAVNMAPGRWHQPRRPDPQALIDELHQRNAAILLIMAA